MEVEVTTSEIYKRIFKTQFIYDSVDFSELNSDKVERKYYLLIKDNNKIRFGVCVGEREQKCFCPFSAPFGIMEAAKYNLDIQMLNDAIEAFDKFCISQKLYSVCFVLPPTIYDESYITLMQNALLQNGYHIKYHDLNFQLNLKKLKIENYSECIPRNGKKNLRISLDSALKFHHCNDLSEIEDAYNTIAINRNVKGYPLKMNFKQVCDTIEIVANDFFLVKKNAETIAAAQVFYVCEQSVQVIYWGDIPGYSELKPVNFLAYNLLKYYSEKKIEFIDIGPSTEFGVPNFGLCNFKISIGCDVSSKLTLEKIY